MQAMTKFQTAAVDLFFVFFFKFKSQKEKKEFGMKDLEMSACGLKRDSHMKKG